MDISVAIGRNVAGFPMSDTDWRAFIACVFAAVTCGDRQFTLLVEEENGQAIYFDHERRETVQEDCYRIIGTIPNDRAPQAYMKLRERLAKLATAYGQWGIALSILTTDMVEGS